ncbi:uncharacterized protein LOC111023135 [Momordica charantia]|uniref:Uncharacterized protein LOC111023135 n=1 Tax=Momordica charantia TaxID=3673 RepID=A0A6J1DU55_MOMCH|nr:uncharacterized protein LOC111023135 [Momordica charantia]XP_022156186.1 uncharacterized protein LOC111023135 [Momordica charantia]
MDHENLLADWQKFKLTSEEDEIAMDVDVDAVKMAEQGLAYSLVGKLLAKRIISADVLSRVLLLAWKVEHQLTVESIGKNLFLFHFCRECDMNRVMKTGPWFFDKALIVLQKPCSSKNISELEFNRVAFWIHLFDLPMSWLNKTMAIRLGNAIGNFVDVDCNEKGFSWGASLRIRVLIDITKPLRRGIKINIDGPMGGCWIPIQYERLPDFCYFCGVIGHSSHDCDARYLAAQDDSRATSEYGPWLRFVGSKAGAQKGRKGKSPAREDSCGSSSMNSKERGVEETKQQLSEQTNQDGFQSQAAAEQTGDAGGRASATGCALGMESNSWDHSINDFPKSSQGSRKKLMSDVLNKRKPKDLMNQNSSGARFQDLQKEVTNIPFFKCTW